jgi:peptidase M50B-like protein
MTKRIVKILLGLTLIPFCLGFSWEFGVSVFSLVYKPEAPYYFIAGGLTYCIVHFLFKKPIFTYVIAHELTHALFAVIFGGSVKSLHASERGGRVTVTKSNFLITLAPYFFPLYTFIAFLLYGAALAVHAGDAATNVLIVLSGAAFTFHIMLTFIFLQTDQSDIREQGALFSYPLIYLFNIAFAALIVDIYLARDMDYLRFLVGGIMKSTGMITLFAKKAYAIIQR